MSETGGMPRTNAAAREAVISEHLKALKLPAFAAEYRGLVRQATEGGWDYEDFLGELLEAELRSREERTAKRRLKEARFPDTKTLDQLDWDALKGVSRQKVMELASCEFLTQARDCITLRARSGPAKPTWGSRSEWRRQGAVSGSPSTGRPTWCAP